MWPGGAALVDAGLVWTAIGTVATCIAEQGRRRAAFREYRAVLELRRRIFGLGHSDTIATRHALERLRAGHATPARHLA